MDRNQSPFPGMDPWLEEPGTWGGVHDALITYIRDDIAEKLPEHYRARIAHREWVETSERQIMPDVAVVERASRVREGTAAATEAPRTAAIRFPVRPVTVKVCDRELREPYIEISEHGRNRRVVTAIEILSPTNKTPGSHGRGLYLRKQMETLRSKTNLVEIDLLRGGQHTVAVPRDLLRPHEPFHYLVVVRRSARREDREVYPIPLDARLPEVRIPLRAKESEPVVDLQSHLDRSYRMGGYDDLDYGREPEPPLSAKDLAWARKLLHPRRPKRRRT